MSLGDYSVLDIKAVNALDIMHVLQFVMQAMCTAVIFAIYICISNLIAVMQVLNLNRAG